MAYQVTVSFTRTAGTESFDIYGIGNGRQFIYALCGWKNSMSGFNLINFALADSNGSGVHGTSLVNGRRATAVMRVYPDKVEVSLNGALLSGRMTDYSNMYLASDRVLPRGDDLGLATYQSSVTIYSDVLVELSTRHTVLPEVGVKIISASWGGGSHWADVTARVKELVVDRLPIWANVDTLGIDPTPGWHKQLRVTYQRDGQVTSASANEGQQLSVR